MFRGQFAQSQQTDVTRVHFARRPVSLRLGRDHALRIMTAALGLAGIGLFGSDIIAGKAIVGALVSMVAVTGIVFLIVDDEVKAATPDGGAPLAPEIDRIGRDAASDDRGMARPSLYLLMVPVTILLVMLAMLLILSQP